MSIYRVGNEKIGHETKSVISMIIYERVKQGSHLIRLVVIELRQFQTRIQLYSSLNIKLYNLTFSINLFEEIVK